MIQSEKAWYAAEVNDDLYEAAMQSGDKFKMAKWWTIHNKDKLIPIGLWFVWLVLGTVWAIAVNDEWTITEGIYFGVSSLSTGGLWAIPNGSADSTFVLGKKNM